MSDYYEIDAWNASKIKQGARSMLHLQNYLANGIKTTSAMNTGSLMHMALLEQDRFSQLHVYDGDKRKKEYKELCADVGKDNIITASEANDCTRAAQMVRNHPVVAVNGWFDYGVAEAEFFWDEPFGKCKAKIDWLREEYWIEYKTTASLGSFISTSARMHYHLQLGWYWKAAGCLPCYVIAQESSAPFDVAVYSVPSYQLKEWYGQCVEIIQRWNIGMVEGAYPEMMHFELPKWADGEDEALEIGEENAND